MTVLLEYFIKLVQWLSMCFWLTQFLVFGWKKIGYHIVHLAWQISYIDSIGETEYL